ncbi:MAG: DUF2065 domain-containing protein [Pseudomonadales bacterium]|nr:DUF2065 domain-containing protein [Pseudomonadales bacterium]
MEFIDWHIFGAAIGLMFVFEGIMPFLIPNRLRSMALMVLKFNNNTIRGMGLFSMVMGLVILSLTQ